MQIALFLSLFAMRLAIIAGPLAMFGQWGTMTGRIYDPREQKGLEMAAIVLNGEGIGAFTDSEGFFRFDSLEPGSYQVKIRYYGSPDSILPEITILGDTLIHLAIDYPPPCQWNKQSNKVCPHCKRDDKAIPIVYGMPVMNKKTEKALRKEKFKLGGSVVSNCDPHWWCRRDRVRF